MEEAWIDAGSDEAVTDGARTSHVDPDVTGHVSNSAHRGNLPLWGAGLAVVVEAHA